LTRTYGAIGAAWSALITQTCTLFLLAYLIEKQKLGRVNRKIIIFMIASLLCSIISCLIIDRIPIPSEYKLILQLILIPLVMVSFGLIPVKSDLALIISRRAQK
jgi:hypothetical protein